MDNITVNDKKVKDIEVDGVTYERYAIKTHVITEVDDIAEVCKKHAGEHIKDGDVLFITEKAVGCTQGRAIPMKDIKPRPLAKFLCKFVLKTPYGIGLGIPETMEMALRECGTLRILFAAAISTSVGVSNRRGGLTRLNTSSNSTSDLLRSSSKSVINVNININLIKK